MEGKNLLEAKDANGVRFNAALIDAAKAGGGYVELLFPAPDRTNLLKLAYLFSPSSLGSGGWHGSLDRGVEARSGNCAP